MKKNKKYQINLENSGKYRFYKLTNETKIVSEGNSEKFANIIANKWVIVNTYTNRVENEANPHIKEVLEKLNIINYRVDGLSDLWSHIAIIEDYNQCNIEVDFENGTYQRILQEGEAICKSCGRVVRKDAVIGCYCESCISSGLANLYSYHGFYGDFTIKEKINQEKTPTFGCEIERDYLGSYISYTSKVDNAMMEFVKTYYKKEIEAKQTIRRDHIFEKDGSLNCNGCEWITYPSTYNFYKKNKQRFDECLKVFENYEFGASNKAGTHIHISREFLGGYSKSKFVACKMALLISRFWDEFKTIANRTETDYCEKPTQEGGDDLFELVEKTIYNQDTHGIAVNQQHKATIEVRIWGAVEKMDDLLLYLDLTKALATFAKKKGLETCQRCQFIDILNYLQDKEEHLTAIVNRLNEKGLTASALNVQRLLINLESEAK